MDLWCTDSSPARCDFPTADSLPVPARHSTAACRRAKRIIAACSSRTSCRPSSTRSSWTDGRTGGYAALRMNLPATSRTAREKGQQAVSRPSWSSGHVTAVRRRSGAEHAVIDRATAAHAGRLATAHLVGDGPGRGGAGPWRHDGRVGAARAGVRGRLRPNLLRAPSLPGTPCTHACQQPRTRKVRGGVIHGMATASGSGSAGRRGSVAWITGGVVIMARGGSPPTRVMARGADRSPAKQRE